MNIYELVGEIESSRLDNHSDNLQYSLSCCNRAKLTDAVDIEVFDLITKAYKITIIYRSEQRDRDTKIEYRKLGDEELVPFTDAELVIFNSLDWTKLPHNLKAHVYDVIWLCNHKYEAAKIAVEEYTELYHEWFDEEHWVQCVDYINRAVELAARIGISEKKNAILIEVYNDVVELNGDDSSFLSISLIDLLVKQKSICDFNELIPLVDRIISRNEGNLSNAYIVEHAYYMKADLYKMLHNHLFENKVYVEYADFLMQGAEKLIKVPKGGSDENRNWFMAENEIKKAIELFQNHGALEKATNAQRRLIEIQKEAVTHIPMHEFKYDVSEFYQKFVAEYECHSVRELIWDVVFAFGFQDKQQIRHSVTNNSSFAESMFPMQMLSSDGQIVFFLPGLKLDDEKNILLYMYHKAREYEMIQGGTVGVWFIQYFRKCDLQEKDLDFVFKNNPIIPKGQEKDVQRGVYYGLNGRMSDALDKLAPRVENIIRNLAEICGDLMTYYDINEHVQKKKVLSQVFKGEKLNECIEENIIFTLDGLLQQKSGSNIRNRIGHGLNTEVECSTGDCIYFVMIVLKFCALYSESFYNEVESRRKDITKNMTDNKIIE